MGINTRFQTIGQAPTQIIDNSVVGEIKPIEDVVNVKTTISSGGFSTPIGFGSTDPKEIITYTVKEKEMADAIFTLTQKVNKLIEYNNTLQKALNAGEGF